MGQVTSTAHTSQPSDKHSTYVPAKWQAQHIRPSQVISTAHTSQPSDKHSTYVPAKWQAQHIRPSQLDQELHSSGYCAASSGNSLQAFRDNLCPIFNGHGFLALEDGIDSLSRNVGKYYWPSNCPEERSSHVLHSVSLKSRIGYVESSARCWLIYAFLQKPLIIKLYWNINLIHTYFTITEVPTYYAMT